jgi:hypothetical protein
MLDVTYPTDVPAVGTLLPGIASPDVPRSASLRSEPRRRIRPNDRYHAVVDLIFRLRMLTDRQIHAVLFQTTTHRGCQRTLTLLVRHKWIDKLPRRWVNEPYIYTLSPKSRIGNRLMQAKYGDAEFRANMFRPGSIPHLLAINDVRIAVEKSCAVDTWRRADQLAELLPRSYRLIPDAYFRIRQQNTSYGYFLELQRSLKSNRILISKLERYGRLFRSEGFPQQFMRVLVVFTTEFGVPSTARVAQAKRLIPQSKYPFAQLVALEELWADSYPLISVS